eukprot:15356090-Ditylum_brightwellii.AAC.1
MVDDVQSIWYCLCFFSKYQAHTIAIDATGTSGLVLLKALRLNVIVICNLTMSFTTEALMCQIYKLMIDNWSLGVVHIVIALHEKYAPKDLVTKIELHCDLNIITINTDNNPDMLFEELSKLKYIYNTATFKISDEALIMTVLEKAPKDHGIVFTCEQRTKGNAFKMRNLNDTMSQFFRSLHCNNANGNDKNNVGLVGADNDVCYRCSKKRHKLFQCKNKKAEEIERKGNPANAHKIQNWWRMGSGGKKKKSKEDEEDEARFYC